MSILVVGDRMVDEYVLGDVERVCPEAPVPVLRALRSEVREGAASNVANNVRAMGVSCELVYSFGSEAVRKVRAIGKNQQMLRIDWDFPQKPVERLGETDAGIVIFSDYGKGSLEHIERLICEAKDRGMRILVDPKGYDYQRYKGADLLKPNRDEMRSMIGGWKSEDELAYHAERMRQAAGIGAILLTRAADGMTLYDESGAHHIAADEHEVFDVTGAGDTAIAAYAVAMHKGFTGLECAKYANRAAGIAVTHFGTAVVGEKEVFGDSRPMPKAVAA